jgi:hypothetical protein
MDFASRGSGSNSDSIEGMETATSWQRSGHWAHLQQQASLHGQSAKSPSSVVQVSAARLSFAALLPLV